MPWEIVLSVMLFLGSVTLAVCSVGVCYMLHKSQEALSESGLMEAMQAIESLKEEVKIIHQATVKARTSQSDSTNLLESGITQFRTVIEKFQEGTLKICASQVEAIVSLEATVSRFRDLMFAGDNKGLQQYDENAADYEYRIRELTDNHGIPRQEAESRIRQADLYKGMNVR